MEGQRRLGDEEGRCWRQMSGGGGCGLVMRKSTGGGVGSARGRPPATAVAEGRRRRRLGSGGGGSCRGAAEATTPLSAHRLRCSVRRRSLPSYDATAGAPSLPLIG
uniref:Uncharacterized protein n=1 Tax=Oryza sativa subsp. japonica TaxID=39947 RepID=Q6YYR3_ORYSJ|nr:hypothetical protein [Oryza sativa Japonica Group]